MRYTVVLSPEPEGGAVNVTVAAMPGVLTWGRTQKVALNLVREGIEVHLEGFVERGLPVPEDRKPRYYSTRPAGEIGNGTGGRGRQARTVGDR